MKLVPHNHPSSKDDTYYSEKENFVSNFSTTKKQTSGQIGLVDMLIHRYKESPPVKIPVFVVDLTILVGVSIVLFLYSFQLYSRWGYEETIENKNSQISNLETINAELQKTIDSTTPNPIPSRQKARELAIAEVRKTGFPFRIYDNGEETVLDITLKKNGVTRMVYVAVLPMQTVASMLNELNMDQHIGSLPAYTPITSNYTNLQSLAVVAYINPTVKANSMDFAILPIVYSNGDFVVDGDNSRYLELLLNKYNDPNLTD